MVHLTAIVHADDLAVALDGEGDGHVVGVDQVAVRILYVDGDVAQIIAVGSNDVAVSREGELAGLAGGLDHAATFGVSDGSNAVGLKGLDFQSAGLIGHPEGGVQALMAVLLREGAGAGSPGAVGVVTARGCLLGGGSSTYFLAVQIELDDGCVGVNHHFHIMVGTEDHVFLVPSGQHMQGSHVLVPLALIEPIGVLGQTVGVDDAEVRGFGCGPGAAGGAGTGAVPGGGLADVVKAGPHKLAHGVVTVQRALPGVAGHSAPAHRALIVRGEETVAVLVALGTLTVIDPAAVDSRSGLGVVHQQTAVDPGVKTAGVGVVDAGNAAELLQDVGNFVSGALVVGILAERGRTGVVHFSEPGAQLTGDAGILGGAVIGGAFEDLVAQAVHDNGRRVLILIGHGLDVELGPGHVGLAAHNGVVFADLHLKPGGIVVDVAVFLHDPHVEGLVDEHHALFVGNLNELRSGGVMGNADGVTAHFLQNLHLTLDGAVPSLGTQGALVMVHTNALELDRFAVKCKTVFAAEGGPAEAELGLVSIHHGVVHQDLGLQGVEVGGIGGPQSGGFYLGGHFHIGGAAGGNGSGLRAGDAGHSLFHTLLIDGLTQRDRSGGIGVVLHGGHDVHGAVSAVAGLQLGGGHIGAVAGHMDRISDGEMNGTIDTAAGIPAAGGGVVLHLDGDHVLSLEVEQLIGQLERESGVAVGMEAQLLTIEVDGGIHVHAAKINGDGLAFPLRGNTEGLAVPARAAGQVAAFGLVAGGIFLLNAIIVGQVHVAPAGVIVIGGGAAVAQVKTPVVVEIHGTAGAAVGVDIHSLFR